MTASKRGYDYYYHQNTWPVGKKKRDRPDNQRPLGTDDQKWGMSQSGPLPGSRCQGYLLFHGGEADQKRP